MAATPGLHERPAQLVDVGAGVPECLVGIGRDGQGTAVGGPGKLVEVVR